MKILLAFSALLAVFVLALYVFAPWKQTPAPASDAPPSLTKLTQPLAAMSVPGRLAIVNDPSLLTFGENGVVAVAPATNGDLALAYSTDRGPEVRTLVFDGQSYCVTGMPASNCTSTGAGTCAATLTSAVCTAADQQQMSGKRASVLGTTNTDGSVTVREFVLLVGRDPAPTVTTGVRFVTWEDAQRLITSCAVRSIGEGRTLGVRLLTKDGSLVFTVEPLADTVVHARNAASGDCGAVPISKE